MKFFLVWTLLLFSIEISYCQVIEREIERKIDSLRKQGVDTIIFYSFTCNGVGLPAPFEDCTDDGDYNYLFWEHFENIYVQKFELCYSFNTLKLSKSFSLNYLRGHLDVIKKERIIYPSFKYYDKKNKRGVELLQMHSSHSCYHKFNFFISDFKLNKTIDVFNLESKKWIMEN